MPAVAHLERSTLLGVSPAIATDVPRLQTGFIHGKHANCPLLDLSAMGFYLSAPQRWLNTSKGLMLEAIRAADLEVTGILCGPRHWEEGG